MCLQLPGAQHVCHQEADPLSEFCGLNPTDHPAQDCSDAPGATVLQPARPPRDARFRVGLVDRAGGRASPQRLGGEAGTSHTQAFISGISKPQQELIRPPHPTLRAQQEEASRGGRLSGGESAAHGGWNTPARTRGAQRPQSATPTGRNALGKPGPLLGPQPSHLQTALSHRGLASDRRHPRSGGPPRLHPSRPRGPLASLNLGTAVFRRPP